MPAPSASASSSLLQAEAVDLDAGQDDRPPAAAIRRAASATASASASGSLAGRCSVRHVRPLGHDADHVARQLDVARPAAAHHRVQHAIDLAKGGLRLVQLGVGARKAGETPRPACGNPSPDGAASGSSSRSRKPGRTANDYHRRLFGIGPGHRIADAQPADAIGHADRPDAVEPGVGVGREPRTIFPRAADQPDRAVLQQP